MTRPVNYDSTMLLRLSDIIAVERCDTTLICFQLMTSHQQKRDHQCAHQCAQIAPKKKKRR